MDFTTYLIDKMLILIPVLYVLGTFIKNTPNVKDWVIPWVLLVIGVVAAVAIGLGAGIPIPEAIIQGVLVTGATVLTNQLIVQTKKQE